MTSAPECLEQCLSMRLGALLVAVRVEQCTYVRTNSHRTTYVDYLSPVAYRAQGGSNK